MLPANLLATVLYTSCEAIGALGYGLELATIDDTISIIRYTIIYI